MTYPRDLLAPFHGRPDRCGVLTDFDGVLSAIEEEHDAARPLAGVGDLLVDLGQRFKVVAVVSGRPVAYLDPLLPPGVLISGLYGLEESHHGVSREKGTASVWREVIDDVATASESVGPAGMDVERKGLSLTLHIRTQPDLAEAVDEWARLQSARSGLGVRAAKMSIELHPPVDVDKGTVVEALAAGLDAVCYVGDDVGDLPAFDALDRLAAAGVHSVRVGVGSPEAAAELVARADLMVEGPHEAVTFLASLLD
ncbi:MAG: trehalose-phosphatase [Acidimicrobiales bacterium]